MANTGTNPGAKSETAAAGKPKVIKMDTLPTKDGKPDIAAILAANGITGVDLSKVKVVNAGGTDNIADILGKGAAK